MGGGLDDGLARGTGRRCLKMPEPTNSLGAELHHQRGVGRVAMPRAQNNDPEGAGLGDLLHHRGSGAWSCLAHSNSSPGSACATCACHRVITEVTDGLDDVAGAGLDLRADHGGACSKPSEGLTEVGRAAHERDVERPLQYVFFF